MFSTCKTIGDVIKLSHSEESYLVFDDVSCSRYVSFLLATKHLPAMLAVIKQAIVAANRLLIANLAMSLLRFGAIGPRPPNNTPRPRKFVKPHRA